MCVCVQESGASIAGDELLADMLQQMEVSSGCGLVTCLYLLTFDPTEPTTFTCPSPFQVSGVSVCGMGMSACLHAVLCSVPLRGSHQSLLLVTLPLLAHHIATRSTLHQATPSPKG